MVDVVLNPLPKKVTKTSLILYLDVEHPKIEFYKFDKTKESISRVIEFDEETRNINFSYSISQVAKMPLRGGTEKKPTFVFTIPERFISKNLCMCLAMETEENPLVDGIPRNVVAVTEPLSMDLQGLLIKKTKKKLIINMKILKKPNNPILLSEECKLILCTHSLEEKDPDLSKSESLFGAIMSTPLRHMKSEKSERERERGLVLIEE